MLRKVNPLLMLAGAFLLLRLISMAIVPFADTTEPRYAEIARVMATSGDWITPWFEPNVPFWGKPPLSFWSQALAINLFGTSELAVRLPAWIATLLTLLLIYRFALTWFGEITARWATLIYSTTALVYVSAGAVMTDTFLTLATTWIMAGIALASTQPRWYWRYGVFIALAIGLLAKGPLVLVLVGGAVFPALFYPELRNSLFSLPLIRGSLLTLALTLPWYIAAEIKTPGFLNYFIVGEHILRFIDPGWAGDLYGSAHRRPHGTIWLLALLATMPWGLFALARLGATVRAKRATTAFKEVIKNPHMGYLVAWALFTPLFFTAAGNILWTYVLPAMPAFAILTAVSLQLTHEQASLKDRWQIRASALTPVLVLIGSGIVFLQPAHLKTEQPLVRYWQQTPDTALVYVGKPPFSARFYAQEPLPSINASDLSEWLEELHKPTLLAVPRNNKKALAMLKTINAQQAANSHSYQLFRIMPSAETADQIIQPPNSDFQG